MNYKDFQEEIYGSTKTGYVTYEELERIAGQRVRGSLLWMALGILITTITAYQMAGQFFVNEFLYNNFETILYGSLILEVLTVIAFTGLTYRVNAIVLKGMFIFYALLNGFTMSTLILAYDLWLLLFVLVGTFVLFTVLAIYGYVTKEDLTKYGGLLRGGVIALIVMGLINIFIGSSSLTWISSMLGVAIFIIFIAYDINRIKNNVIEYALTEDSSIMDKIEIHGALSLYLDFINLFLYILRFFSKKNK